MYNPPATVECRPLLQSTGRVLEGGDCGYCCVAGVFGFPTILAAYEDVERLTGEPRAQMYAFKLHRYLEKRGVPVTELRPEFDYYKPGMTPYPWLNGNWPRMVRSQIDDGRVLLTSIRFDGGGPVCSAVEVASESDHMVLINGWRERLVPLTGGASRIDQEIRVGCSVRGDYWVEWQRWLYRYGGYCCVPLTPVETTTGTVTS